MMFQAAQASRVCTECSEPVRRCSTRAATPGHEQRQPCSGISGVHRGYVVWWKQIGAGKLYPLFVIKSMTWHISLFLLTFRYTLSHSLLPFCFLSFSQIPTFSLHSLPPVFLLSPSLTSSLPPISCPLPITCSLLPPPATLSCLQTYTQYPSLVPFLPVSSHSHLLSHTPATSALPCSLLPPYISSTLYTPFFHFPHSILQCSALLPHLHTPFSYLLFFHLLTIPSPTFPYYHIPLLLHSVHPSPSLHTCLQLINIPNEFLLFIYRRIVRVSSWEHVKRSSSLP